MDCQAITLGEHLL